MVINVNVYLYDGTTLSLDFGDGNSCENTGYATSKKCNIGLSDGFKNNTLQMKFKVSDTFEPTYKNNFLTSNSSLTISFSILLISLFF